jgi:hypothetical protein
LTAYRVTEYFIGTGTRRRDGRRENEKEITSRKRRRNLRGALSVRFHVKLGMSRTARRRYAAVRRLEKNFMIEGLREEVVSRVSLVKTDAARL